MATSTLTLSTARPRDAEFLYRLTEETMRSYAEATWGTWNGDLVRQFTEKSASDGSFQLILRDGTTVGALRMQRLDSHMQLDQLFISKPYQRQGIGTQLVRGLIAEARSANKPLRLRVLRTNPAKALYERLGFVVTQTTKERYFMEYSGLTLGGTDGP
jgi:ribosomal protein S18 acetylase RimI-like enzyme